MVMGENLHWWQEIGMFIATYQTLIAATLAGFISWGVVHRYRCKKDGIEKEQRWIITNHIIKSLLLFLKSLKAFDDRIIECYRIIKKADSSFHESLKKSEHMFEEIQKREDSKFDRANQINDYIDEYVDEHYNDEEYLNENEKIIKDANKFALEKYGTCDLDDHIINRLERARDFYINSMKSDMKVSDESSNTLSQIYEIKCGELENIKKQYVVLIPNQHIQPEDVEKILSYFSFSEDMLYNIYNGKYDECTIENKIKEITSYLNVNK